jgi:hypothetical protein
MMHRLVATGPESSSTSGLVADNIASHRRPSVSSLSSSSSDSVSSIHTRLDTSTRTATENAAIAATVSIPTTGKRSPFTVLIFIVNVTIGDLRRKVSFEQIRTVILRYSQESVNAARQYISHEGDKDEDDEDNEDNEQYTPLRVIREYKFGLKEFNMLLEKLPMQLNDYVLKLDLWDGYLSVRTVPGDPHGTATGIFCQQLLLWSQDATNMTIVGQPLNCAIDVSMFFSSAR